MEKPKSIYGQPPSPYMEKSKSIYGETAGHIWRTSCPYMDLRLSIYGERFVHIWTAPESIYGQVQRSERGFAALPEGPNAGFPVLLIYIGYHTGITNAVAARILPLNTLNGLRPTQNTLNLPSGGGRADFQCVQCAAKRLLCVQWSKPPGGASFTTKHTERPTKVALSFGAANPSCPTDAPNPVNPV